jgi:hypothetical protein
MPGGIFSAWMEANAVGPRLNFCTGAVDKSGGWERVGIVGGFRGSCAAFSPYCTFPLAATGQMASSLSLR